MQPEVIRHELALTERILEGQLRIMAGFAEAGKIQLMSTVYSEVMQLQGRIQALRWVLEGRDAP